MNPTEYEAEVLRQRTAPPAARPSRPRPVTSRSVFALLLWQVAGAGAIALWSQSRYSLAELQGIYTAFALLIGGLEAHQQRGQRMYALAVVGVGLSWLAPAIALLSWLYGGVVFLSGGPPILATTLMWCALVALLRAYVFEGGAV